MQPRYLAHAVLHNGEVWRTSSVTITANGTVSIERFNGETPSTIFVSGIVCVCAEHRMNDMHRRALTRIVASARLIETAIRYARKYMDDNNLFLNSSECETTPLLLPLKR